MAELVEVVAARHQHVTLDGVADRAVEVGGGQVEDRAERGVRDAAAGHGGRAYDGDGRVVELLEADQQHVGEVLGDAAAAGPRGTDELLDEERVALGAADDVADPLLRQRVGVEALDQEADVVGVEGLELDPLDAGHPGPHGDLPAERVTAVEVVGPVGADQGHGRLEAAPEQEADQVARRLVGPVEVLHDQEQGLVGAGRLREGVDAVEQGGLVGRDGLGVGGLAQHPLAGQQTEQGGVAGRDVVEQLGHFAGDPAGDLGEGQVGKGGVGEVEAVPGEHLPAAVDDPVAELGEEPCLADAGVSGEQDEGALVERGDAGRGDAERGAQVLQLGISSDQLRRHAVHDVVDHGRHLS